MNSSGLDNPVRIGQVGVGSWGRNVLRNFMSLPHARVVAVCDQSQSVLDKVLHQYPLVTKTTRRFEDLLTDDTIEAVVIATETPHHYSMAAKALSSGKHVFVEKPLTQTVREAEHLVRLSEDQGKHLMVGHLLLYHPAFQHVESLIRKNVLGNIHYLYSVRVNLGIIRQKESAFDSLGPHDVSIALAFIDRQPVAVSANGQSYLQKGIEDVVFATLYFEGGPIAHMHTSWLDPHKVRKVTVVGQQKMAVIDDTATAEKVRIFDKGVGNDPGSYESFGRAMSIRSGDILIPKIPPREPLKVECSHFLESIRTGTTPRTDGKNGLAVVRVMEAVRKSLQYKGQCVEIDL